MDATWQSICILSLVLTGLAVAFVHDIYRAFIKAIRIKGLFFAVAEIVFAFIIFTFVSAVMVWLTSGVLRPIYLVSIMIGVVIYYLIWGKKIQNVARRVINYLKKIVLKIARTLVRICYVIGRIITWPIEVIFKIITCIANGFSCIMRMKR